MIDSIEFEDLQSNIKSQYHEPGRDPPEAHQRCDLVKPITSLISGSHSVDDKASLAELQALRVKMVSSIKNKTFTDATLRDMENYFDQLGSESNQ